MMTEKDITKILNDILNSITFKGKKIKAKQDMPIGISQCPIITFNISNLSTLKTTINKPKTYEISFTVNLWTENSIDRADIGELIQDKLEGLNFRLRQSFNSYESDTKIYRKYSLYSAEIDKIKNIIYGGI